LSEFYIKILNIGGVMYKNKQKIKKGIAATLAMITVFSQLNIPLVFGEEITQEYEYVEQESKYEPDDEYTKKLEDYYTDEDSEDYFIENDYKDG